MSLTNESSAFPQEEPREQDTPDDTPPVEASPEEEERDEEGPASSQNQDPPPSFLSGWDWSGELRIGWREVKVNGSEPQFDADVNLDRGFRILSLEVEGHSEDSGDTIDHFKGSASGIDDPFANADVLFENTDVWTAEARWRRSDTLFSSIGDFHPYHSKRHQVDLIGTWTPHDAWTFDLAYQNRQRAGRWRPTRNVGDGAIAIDGVAPFHEQWHDVDAGASWVPSELGSLHFDVGWGTGRRDDVRYLAGDLIPNAPFQPIEQLDAKERSQSARLGASGRLEPVPDQLWLEGGIHYGYVRRDIDAGSTRLDFLFDGSDEFFEDANVEGERLASEIEVGMRPAERLTSIVYYRNRVSAEDDELTSIQISRDPPFQGVIVPTGIAAINGVETRLDAIGTELDWNLTDELLLRGGYQYAQDRIESGLAGIDQTVYSHGPSTGFTWRPSKHWRFTGDYRAIDTTQPLTEASSGDLDHYRARAEWLPTDQLIFALGYERTDSRQNTSALATRTEAFDVNGTWVFEDTGQVHAGVTWRQIRSRTRVLYATPPPNAPFLVGYDGEEVVSHVDFVYDRLDPIGFELSFTHVRLAGDFPYDLLDIAGGPTLALEESWRVGLEYRHRRYNERNATPNDYAADLWLAYLVWTF
ncbi:MAG: hypothetical protein RL885_23005 [Planctomycetota bacterium]